LEFVSGALNASLDHAMRERGGFRALRCGAAPPCGLIRIRLEFTLPSQAKGWFSFGIGEAGAAPHPPRWQVIEEECHIQTNVNAGEAFYRVTNGVVESSWGAPTPTFAVDRLWLSHVADDQPFREILEAFCDMWFYRISPSSIVDIETREFSRGLFFDGRNLANVLAVLRTTSSETKGRPEEFLRVVMPTLKRVTVEPVMRGSTDGNGNPANSFESQKISLVFHQRIGDSPQLFGPRQMSEGTLRTLAILTALYQVNPATDKRPSLTAIEDVESAIHPAVLAVLRDALTEASYTTQVLVTTQSSDLLDSNDVETDSILAVSADDGLTRIAPVDKSSRGALQKRLYTVGELMRIGHLFPQVGAESPLETAIGAQP
jgi:AAA domain, putative AbiEii toxin, Type IV TA system